MFKLGKKINKTIQNVFLTNSAASFSLGLVMPFIAVFAKNDIQGGSIEVAGIAAGISPFLQGFAQFGSGIWLDRLTLKNERAPFYFFIARQAIDVAYMLVLIFVFLPWHLYTLQAVRGLTSGIAMPAGSMIQAKYADKGKEGEEWGISGGIVSIFHGIGGLLAGIIIASLGFKILFVFGAVFFLLATIIAVKTLLEYNKAISKNRSN